jgi:large subunit ribosomal protein L23
MALLRRKNKESEDQKPAVESAQSAPKLKEDTGDSYKVLIKPLLSEKTNHQLAQGKLSFRVSDDANKISVRKAVEKVYDVKVKDVNIVMVRGKKRAHGRTRRMGSDWKKAVVTLKDQSQAQGVQA